MKKIILKTIKELNNWKANSKEDINFVPTMGNLHNGHAELILYAKKFIPNKTLVSIFINPLQFDNEKDLITYPKTQNKDMELAFSSGAEAIFIPSRKEIFPENNISYKKASEKLSSKLCGLKRIGHFDGVCTVVYRLLDIVKPKTIFLGEKDWQQLIILKNMIKEMKLNIEVKSISNQRDIDMVPYSSRNNLLTKTEREKLRIFSYELLNAKNNFNKDNIINTKNIIRNLEDKNIKVEYLNHLSAYDLKETIKEENITILAGAILCGDKRLIDNVFLMKRNPIIAIDGPAGSGKSTISKLIAKKLNFIYLDTGAMYRALSWFLINEKINYSNSDKLEKCLKETSIIFKSNLNESQDVFINNFCVTEKIRSQKISSLVSSIASINIVRKFLVNEQQKIGAEGGIVAEGRDIGTTVFPKAEIKIFLTASIEERSKRRKLELENKGHGKIKFNEIKNQIKKRDFDDSNRKISPLRKAKDALEIFTDGLTIDQIVNKIIDIYYEKIPKELQK